MTNAKLRSFYVTDKLQYPNVPELLALDVTYLTPQEAAARIDNHVRSISAALQPASKLYLQLR
jgi:hypothetical protein